MPAARAKCLAAFAAIKVCVVMVILLSSKGKIGVSPIDANPHFQNKIVAYIGTVKCRTSRMCWPLSASSRRAASAEPRRASALSKSIISRRIARLEADLGVRLLNRTTRGIAPTEAGLEFKERCVEILRELDAAREAVACRERDVAGTLRLAVPLSFGIARLGAGDRRLCRRNIRASRSISSFSDRFVDLVSEGFDAAIRVGVLRRHEPRRAPSRLGRSRRRRKPCLSRKARHAGKAAGARRPRMPHLFGRRARDMAVPQRSKMDERQARKGAFAPTMARFYALRRWRDLGITALPDFLVEEALARGALVRLLEAYPMPEASIHLLAAGGRTGASAVSALGASGGVVRRRGAKTEREPFGSRQLNEVNSAPLRGDQSISSETRASSDMRAWSQGGSKTMFTLTPDRARHGADRGLDQPGDFARDGAARRRQRHVDPDQPFASTSTL